MNKDGFYKVLLIIVCLCLPILGCRHSRNRVCFESDCVNVAIAQTQEERSQGLQNRKALADDAGMLFIFPRNGKHRFWMKDTLIPLDMLWIDRYQTVVDIQHGAVPCRAQPCQIYAPDQAALYVLEVNAGYAREHGIKVGERADFDIRFD
jgi:hypothetical protein